MKIDWDSQIWSNKILANEFVRYFLLLVVVFILGIVLSPIKPSVITFLTNIWIKGIIIFLSLAILIYDIDHELTYKNIVIILLVTIVFTICFYFFILRTEDNIEKDEIQKLKRRLQHQEIIEIR